MLIKSISISLLASLLLGAANVTQALEPAWKFVEAKVTPVSGIPGRVQVIQLNKTRNQGLSGITIREDRNRPCNLYVHPKNLDDTSTQSENEVSYDDNETNKCKGRPGDSITAGFGDKDRSYIRAIATCASKVKKNKNRVKGLRAVAAKVWQSKREIDELATTDSDTQPNCEGGWHETVYCDSGHVAIGVNVHWSVIDEITGISLRCGYVSWLGSGS